MSETDSLFSTPWGEGQVAASFEEQEQQAQTRAEAAAELLKLFGDNYFESLGNLDVSRLDTADELQAGEKGPGRWLEENLGYDPTINLKITEGKGKDEDVSSA